MKKCTVAFAAALVGAAAFTPANADTLTVEAFDNSTIQPAGPRAGTSNLSFFNVESAHNGSFASYGATDFDGSSFVFGAPVLSINSVELLLTESNAAFTTAGSLRFYLTQDTTTIIANTGGSPAFFDQLAPPTGLGTQFDPKNLVATGAFTTTGNINSGQVDTYPLSLGAGDLAYLITQLNTGGTIRMLVAPDDDLVAATFAGFNNTTFDGPRLRIDATLVPEPTLLGALAMLAPVTLIRRR